MMRQQHVLWLDMTYIRNRPPFLGLVCSLEVFRFFCRYKYLAQSFQYRSSDRETHEGILQLSFPPFVGKIFVFSYEPHFNVRNPVGVIA